MQHEFIPWENLLIESSLEEAVTLQLELQLGRLLSRFALPKRQKISIIKQLFSLYQETHRAYHNLSHIWNLRQIFRELRSDLDQPDVVELAIWFHDAIYDPSSKTNELDSSALMRQALESFIPESMVLKCANLIDSTARHHPRSSDRDIRFFLDMDLAILAAPEPLYYTYTISVREEYKQYTNAVFIPGRKAVLQHFLDRPSLYFSAPFQQQLEASARANLTKELESLNQLI
ncbi:MAG: hypothetical protein AAFV80_13460 [Bacteroidota bacterium]